MAFGVAVDRGVTRAIAERAGALLAAVPFRVDVARERDGVRVCPSGEVDVATIRRLRERIEEALAAGTGRLILDLRETTFLDSTGLRLAMEADARAARNGTEFSIIAGPAAVQRAFDVAGLTELLPFIDAPRPELRAI
jgi:anti-sigma B factor antagonist